MYFYELVALVLYLRFSCPTNRALLGSWCQIAFPLIDPTALFCTSCSWTSFFLSDLAQTVMISLTSSVRLLLDYPGYAGGNGCCLFLSPPLSHPQLLAKAHVLGWRVRDLQVVESGRNWHSSAEQLGSFSTTWSSFMWAGQPTLELVCIFSLHWLPDVLAEQDHWWPLLTQMKHFYS